MLGRFCGLARSSLVVGGRRCRGLASESGTHDGKSDEPGAKEVVGEELLSAVDDVAKDLHVDDKERIKSTKASLLSRLIAHEKDTFRAATSDHTSEMLSDPSVVAVLKEASVPDRPVHKAIEERKTRQGLVLLRKEVFYQAVQSGYSAEEARRISEDASVEAEKRVEEKKGREREKTEEKEDEEGEEKVQREERENKLYEMAYQLAEKMLYGSDDSAGGSNIAKKVIEPDPSAPRILHGKQRLNIFRNPKELQERKIGFWEDLELRAARTWNDNIGPENAFEEQIVWTKQGKQWPFPINNEYMMGEEEKVPFYSHIFVDRLLSQSDLPKEGPIAHFMHLVAVGLSKNPHMTAAKKAEHIQW